MALIDELRSMYGLDQDEEDPVQKMLQAPDPVQPEPMQLDPAVTAATTSDMSQPNVAPASDLGHPQVIDFLKQLEQQGAFKSEALETPKGMKAKTATMTQEVGGPDAEQRAAGVASRGQFELDNALVDKNRMLQTADQLAEDASNKRIDASLKEEQIQKEQDELAKKQERLRSQQAELAGQADEPINPKRYFDNMGFFAKVSSVISAGIYGYLGGRGQAPVVESLMQMAKEDVAAQMADNSAKRGQRNSLIEQYERQYGDSTLVAKRLEADKLLTMSKRAEAEAKDAKSVEVRAAAQDLDQKLKNRVGLLHREIQEATFEKPTQVTTTFETPKPAGTGADMAAKIKRAAELKKTLVEAGSPPDEVEAMLKAAGLPNISGETMAAQKLAADKAESERKAGELSPEKQKDIRDRVDGLAASAQALNQLDSQLGYKRNDEGEVMARDAEKTSESVRSPLSQVAGAGAGMLPFGMDKGATQFVETLQGEDVKALERIRDRIVFGQAKAEGAGALGDAERETYRSRIPTNSVLSVQRASTEALKTQRQNYKNLVGEYGKAAVDAMLRKRGIDPAVYGSLEP